MPATDSTLVNQTALDGYARATFSDGTVYLYNTKTHNLIQNANGAWILEVIHTSPPVNPVIPPLG